MRKTVSFLVAGLFSSSLLSADFKPVVGGKLSYFLWQGTTQGTDTAGEEANNAANKLAESGTL